MENLLRRCVCTIAVLAWSASSASVPARAAAHAVVRYAALGEPTTLSPLFLSGGWYSLVSNLAFEALLRLAPGNRFVPGLALEEPTVRNGGISPDGRHVTFHLRRGTTWADGVPVTSDDVRFAVEQVLNPANDVGDRSGFDRIRGIRTPDPYTIAFDFDRPEPAALYALAFVIPLPKHLLNGMHDLNRAPYNALPVGNGPFDVVEWKRGDVVRFRANPRYWRGRPAVPEIDVKIVPSMSTALLQLRTRETDLAYVPPAMVPQLSSDGIVRAVAPSLAWTELGFNVAVPALADRRVRRAIELAIDRRRLTRVMGHGLAETDRVMQPLFSWALDPSVEPPPADVTLANRLLDEAGWRVGPQGFRTKGNASLDLTMVYTAGNDGVLPTTIASDLEAVHVRVEQKPVQATVLFNTSQAGGILARGNFDLSLLSFQGSTDPGIDWLRGCAQRPPNGDNFWHYCNARLDAESKVAASTLDRPRRLRALASVQRELIDDVAFVPLYRIDQMWAHAGWLHGVVPSGYGPFWNAYAWTIGE